MIDFTKAIEELNNYKGSEKKKTLIHDNKKYLVRIKKVTSEYPSAICKLCHFCQIGRVSPTVIKETCALTAESIHKCVYEVAPFCYLQIIRECKTL